MTVRVLLVAFFVCSVWGLTQAASARTVHIGAQDDVENPVYLFKSVYHSYREYQAAKNAAELGINPFAADDHICYDGYGCFYKNGTYSNFYNLPASPKDIGTKFYLYASAEQKDPEVLDYNNIPGIHLSNFRTDKPTIFVIHGFSSSIKAQWAEPFRAAMFRGSPGGLNYIFVDWSNGAKAPYYWQAASNTQVAGAQLAKMVATLNKYLETKSSSFHLIGHSLGAHTAGFTAHKLREYGHDRVGKITGLDPAGPIFEESHMHAKLSYDDADFVTGIHGNAVGLLSGGLGLYDRVGDIDFYPNGGQFQPGCPFLVAGVIESILTLDWDTLPHSVSCNHNRAIAYAIDSVDNACSHVSYGCDNYANFKEGRCFAGEKAVMGVFVDNKPARQEHFLVTKESEETGFCAHPMKISLQLSRTSTASSGSLFVTLIGKNGVEETVEQMATMQTIVWANFAQLTSDDDEDLQAAKMVVEIVASRTKVADLTAVTVRYEPECGWIYCSPDTITADSIEVDSLESDGTQLCGGFEVLYKAETVKFLLTRCRT